MVGRLDLRGRESVDYKRAKDTVDKIQFDKH